MKGHYCENDLQNECNCTPLAGERLRLLYIMKPREIIFARFLASLFFDP